MKILRNIYHACTIHIYVTETYRTGKTPAEHVHPIEEPVWYLYSKIFQRYTLFKTIQGSYTIFTLLEYYQNYIFLTINPFFLPLYVIRAL